MEFHLEFLPIVSAAAGVLAGLRLNHKCIVVDHFTIDQVEPNKWDLVFLLAAETTFKIRPAMERIGDKLVVICTSSEPGLDRWSNIFFPHWLFCIHACNQITVSNSSKPLLFDALLGRKKDARTKLLQEINTAGLIGRGIVSYSPGAHYKSQTSMESNYYSIWDYEEDAIKELYQTEDRYQNRDSTTRLKNGYFSSCLIPKNIYNQTAISLVAETDNLGNHVFVTEKTWKPIIQNRPAIFYATAEHESFLESIGLVIPYKCYGDASRAVQGLLEPQNQSYLEHNCTLTNPEYWYNKLYDWLDRFR